MKLHVESRLQKISFKNNIKKAFFAALLVLFIFIVIKPSFLYKNKLLFSYTGMNELVINGYSVNNDIYTSTSKDPSFYLMPTDNRTDEVRISLSELKIDENTPLEIQLYECELDGSSSEDKSVKKVYIKCPDHINLKFSKEIEPYKIIRVDIGSRVGIQFKIDKLELIKKDFGIYPYTIIVFIIAWIVMFCLVYYFCKSKIFDLVKKYIIRDNMIFILIAIVSLFFFSCFTYTDIMCTSRNGINVWESIFSGKFFQFYSFNDNLQIANGHFGTFGAMYNIVLYLVFAIWDFPLWVYENLIGIDSLTTTAGILYAKSILLLFTFLVIKEINEIAIIIGVEKKSLKIIDGLFLTSLFYWDAVIILGQYDLLALIFILAGIKYNLKSKNFTMTLIFCFAILFKQFALIPYIVIVLLSEKRIPKIIFRIVAVLPGYILTEVTFLLTDHDAKIRMNESAGGIIRVLETNLFPAALSQIMPGVLLILLVFSYCYLFEKEKSHDEIEYILMAFLSFFGMCYTNPYWVILLEPFLILVIFDNKINAAGKTALILFEMIMSGGYTISALGIHKFSYSLALVKYTWLGRILEKYKPTTGTFGEVLSPIDYIAKFVNSKDFNLAGNTLFILGIIGFVYIMKKKASAVSENIVINNGQLLFTRLILGVCMSMVIILTYCFV